ncbi:MAG: LysM peptidoglycan-binding domain-containing protein [Planctomycetota bacterium]|nr:LysM peptidoglycan-binding domain-containing protein [Planctomycetota bacterium]
MQKIERYGVIALVVLLVTILAVSLWGEGGSSWKFWEKKDAEASAKKDEAPKYVPPTDPFGQLPTAGQLPTEGTSELPGAIPTPGLTGSGAVDPRLDPTMVNHGSVADLPHDMQTGTHGFVPQNGGAPIVTPVGGSSMTTPVPTPTTTPGVPERRTPPVVAGARTYTVKQGDTLGGIAARELGSATRWTEIQKANDNLAPEKLRVGMTINLPASSGKVAKNDERKPSQPKRATGGRTYVVRNGDSLSRIAARELGEAGRWTEIRDMNPGLDPNRLKVGASIQIPGTTVASAQKNSETIGWGPRTSGKTAVQ